MTQEKEMLLALRAQIEEIHKHFKTIRSEAADIVSTSQMPDATLHLNDVLESTEQATTTIIDAATAIGYVAEEAALSPESRKKINGEISRIYEACSFQDISGQRIKKVLSHMNALEAQLVRLSDTAKSTVAPPNPVDPLLNGPQLSSQAPTQSEVDRLFGKPGASAPE